MEVKPLNAVELKRLDSLIIPDHADSSWIKMRVRSLNAAFRKMQLELDGLKDIKDLETNNVNN